MRRVRQWCALGLVVFSSIVGALAYSLAIRAPEGACKKCLTCAAPVSMM
jgi:hypothetical protein